MIREVQLAKSRTDARWRVRRAFTLIEVLTVISMLTVLLLATLPAYRSARTNAQRHAAASEAMEIASAALEFRRVYGSWPCEEEAEDGGTTLTAGPKDGSGDYGPKLGEYNLDIGKVVNVLLGEDSSECRPFNPRAIQFLELSLSCLRTNHNDTISYPYDPWGRPYILVMSRAVQKRGHSGANVNRIEGGLAFDIPEGGSKYTVETPDDAVVFSWGDPMMITNKAAPTRIVGSWSTR